MAKRSERSIALWAIVFVFACLLLGGGSRLIACDAQGKPADVRPVSMVRAAFAGMPAPRPQTGRISGDESVQLHLQAMPVPENFILKDCVLSDANGNVLCGKTYMRAVYQAFVLDDGFV